jgi:predicted unusual protein kinase regulating ubiquinone biosynthesis (AarF/ABC1/UbiB family)
MYYKIKELETMEFNSFKYIFNCIKLYMRIFHILFILIQSYIEFNWNNFILYLKNNEPEKRLELIKNITRKLEELNIVYIKIFQSLCLNDNILNTEEKDYLLKYTDSVPFLSSDINYEILDTLESKYNIRLDIQEPLNSGIVSVAFKGIYMNDNNKVVVKILKNNIKQRLENVFEEIEFLLKLMNIIPYIKNFNLKKTLLDNKDLLLEQTDFKNEANNIEVFRNININNEEFVFPKCYLDITEQYNNVIVMENIKGLTYTDIKNYDDSIKQEFGKLLLKFGLISILYNSAVHCDVHPGNLFFYINEENSNKPKYQLGYIDFGIVCFPSRDNQNYYYKFFKNIQIDKEYDKIMEVIGAIIEEKNKFENLSVLEKNKIKEESISSLTKYASNENFDFKLFFNLSLVLNNYGLSFSKEFNQLCLCIQVVNALGESLCKKENLKKFQDEIMESFNQINKLIEI